MVINAYFPIKEKGECIGAISLWEMHPNMKIPIWQTYKIYPVSEKTILFQKNDKEFCITGNNYEHEMGIINIKEINGFINVKIEVNDEVK